MHLWCNKVQWELIQRKNNDEYEACGLNVKDWWQMEISDLRGADEQTVTFFKLIDEMNINTKFPSCFLLYHALLRQWRLDRDRKRRGERGDDGQQRALQHSKKAAEWGTTARVECLNISLMGAKKQQLHFTCIQSTQLFI